MIAEDRSADNDGCMKKPALEGVPDRLVERGSVWTVQIKGDVVAIDDPENDSDEQYRHTDGHTMHGYLLNSAAAVHYVPWEEVIHISESMETAGAASKAGPFYFLPNQVWQTVGIWRDQFQPFVDREVARRELGHVHKTLDVP